MWCPRNLVDSPKSQRVLGASILALGVRNLTGCLGVRTSRRHRLSWRTHACEKMTRAETNYLIFPPQNRLSTCNGIYNVQKGNGALLHTVIFDAPQYMHTMMSSETMECFSTEFSRLQVKRRRGGERTTIR